MHNPIIAEIRQARAALDAEHNYDLVRIHDWARKQTEAHELLLMKQLSNQKPETTERAPKPPVARKRRARPSGVSV